MCNQTQNMMKFLTSFRNYGKLTFFEEKNIGLNSVGKEVIISKNKVINYIQSANNFKKSIRKDKLDLMWVVSIQKWYKYEKGYWRPIHSDMLNNWIINVLGIESFNYQPKIILALKSIYLIESLPHNSHIGFLNGVLRTDTKRLIKHSPKNYIKGILPYNYLKDRKITKENFPNIHEWQLFVCNDNQELLKLLIYYKYCIIFSITKYQIFLEIQGPGGTGKSTFIKLISNQIGMENVISTQLKQLEYNRFETFGLVNKKLIIITDSETYTGNVSILKSITGEDPIRIEEKLKSVSVPLILNGLIIIATNEFIKSKDYTTGLSRRRITIVFNKKLRNFNPSINKVFSTLELEFFLNYIIQQNPNDIHNFFNLIHQHPLIVDMRNKVNIATNPISYFIDETINIYTSSSIYKSELYRIYRNFCKIHGLSVMSSPRFQNLFIENKANIHKSFKADKFKYYNIAVYEGPYLSYFPFESTLLLVVVHLFLRGWGRIT